MSYVYVEAYDDLSEEQKTDTESVEYWSAKLNERAAELGLDRMVKGVLPAYPGESVQWVYESDEGSLVDLGWSVERADEKLKEMAAAS